MKKYLKIISLLLIITIMLNLSGCWNWRELNTLAIVMAFGIDKSEASDEIELTAQIVKSDEPGSSSAKGKNSGESSFVNVKNTGKDVFAIVRDYSHEISRKLYIGHNQIIVFGESSAKEGIRDSLDFFMRDHEGRMTVYVFIAKGSAYDVLDVKPAIGKIPATEIAQLVENQIATSESVKLTMSDLISNLVSSTKSMVAPYLDIVGDGEERKVTINGSAVFKDDRVVGKLDKKETRGYLWVMGKVKSGIINVNVLGEKASLEIIKAKSKVVPQINGDGSIKIKVKIIEEVALGSQTGIDSLNKMKNTKTLEDTTSDAIKTEILQTLNKAREMGTDIYGFGESINRRYPKEWKTIEANWDELFKKIDVEIEVTSKLCGGGRIVNPIYPEKELIE